MNSLNKKIIMILLIVLTVSLLLVGCSYAPPDSPHSNVVDNSNSKVNNRLYIPGEEAIIGGISIIQHGIAYRGYGSGLKNSPPEGTSYIDIEFEIENTTSEDITVNLADAVTVVIDDVSYVRDSIANAYYLNSKVSRKLLNDIKVLRAREKVEGYITGFAIPSGDKGMKIIVAPFGSNGDSVIIVRYK